MNLLELANLGLPARPERVPDWTLGCFRRRSISFCNGATDDETEVLWLQSHSLTADLRLQPGRPSALETASVEELVALAEVEGGLASTRWDGQAMYWSDWVSFQTHGKWPEPGLLRRVGQSLIEFAPSGAYVEDWRLQSSSPGPLIGLRLLEELDRETRSVLHRGGGLIVCGDHAALVRGRPREPAWQGRVADFARAHRNNPEMLRAVFSCDAAYARKDPHTPDYRVVAATHTARYGQSLLNLNGFSYDPEQRLVHQIAEENGQVLERRFTVDTLVPNFETIRATPASAEAEQWLEREAGTLLTFAR